MQSQAVTIQQMDLINEQISSHPEFSQLQNWLTPYAEYMIIWRHCNSIPQTPVDWIQFQIFGVGLPSNFKEIKALQCKILDDLNIEREPDMSHSRRDTGVFVLKRVEYKTELGNKESAEYSTLEEAMNSTLKDFSNVNVMVWAKAFSFEGSQPRFNLNSEASVALSRPSKDFF